MESFLFPASPLRRAYRKIARLCIFILAAMLILPTAAPAQSRRSYYQGMHNQVRRGDYNRYSRDDERRHHHESGGGIGPGKGALIGTAGGAALGAIFGRSMKSTIIGGAAGAAAGAIGGAIADHDNNRNHQHR